MKISTVRSLEPGQREATTLRREMGIHMCQIKPDETRNVLILLSSMHIHIWEPERRKGVIFNLDYATTLLIWIFSSTYYEPSLNRRSCFCTFPNN